MGRGACGVGGRLALTVLLAVAVVAVGLPVAGRVPVAVAVESVALPAEGRLVREDRVSAQVVAWQTGRRVLVVGETTAWSESYANPDGTFTVEVTAGPARVWDPEAGVWREVDTTLVADERGVHPRVAAAEVRFPRAGGTVVHLAEGDRSVDLSWAGFELPEPELDGPVARYRDVAPGVDLELQALTTGFAKRIVLTRRPTKRVAWRLPLVLHGLAATRTETGGLELRRGDGKLVASSDPAWMWGAETDPVSGEPTRVAEVATRLVDTAKGQMLEVEPDWAFLSDPEVVYPVTVDPSTTITASSDTFVQSNISNTSQWSSDELRWGPTTVARPSPGRW